jgi:hypothetical protein
MEDVPAGFIFIEPAILYSGSFVLDLYHAQKGRPLASRFSLSIFSPSHAGTSFALLFTDRAKTLPRTAVVFGKMSFDCLKFFIIILLKMNDCGCPAVGILYGKWCIAT